MAQAKIVVPGLLVLAGCGLFSDKAQRGVKYEEHTVVDKTIVSFSTPSDLRLAFLRDPTSKAVYCAEPMPDVALGSESTASGKLAVSTALTQAASANSALERENQSLRSENEKLHRELENAISSYERETDKSYSSSSSATFGTTASSSSNASANLEASARLAVTVSQLGGRTPEVLLAREYLYRLCEAGANGWLDTSDKQLMATLEISAMRMVLGVYESKTRASDAELIAANANLLKEVNAYNTMQTKLCNDTSEACKAAAADDAAKKKCAEPLQKCLAAIKPLAAPELKKGPAPLSPAETLPLNL